MDDYNYEVRKMDDLELEYRSAVEAEATPKEDEQLVDSSRELELKNYMEAVINGRKLEGREAEYNQEMNFGDHTVPWEALAPARRSLETRADAVSAAPTLSPNNQQEMVRRVFADTGATYLGIDMPSAAPGAAYYPVLTSAIAPGTLPKDKKNESQAASFTPTILKPKRLHASYLFRVEDLAELQGLEEALREDLSSAMGERLDKALLTDDGTSTANFEEVEGMTTALTEVDKSTDIVTFTDFVELYSTEVDGRYAMDTSDVKVLTGPELYNKSHTTFETTAVRESAASYIGRIGGGWRVSAHIPTTASDKKQHAIVSRSSMRGSVAPIFGGLRLIRDEFSGAESGHVKVTATMLYDFAVLRSAQFNLKNYKFIA